jgi:hypothetical protein
MSQAQKKVAQAIKNIGRARHLNFLVTETLELANSGLNNALKKGQEPFSVVVKDNFA